jgi:Plasmid pRiA4b ORF-3-like protein
MAHKFNIVLKGSDPKIFRKVIVPENFTFDQLHIVIQIVMGWTNSHMHQFNLGVPYNSPVIKPKYLAEDGMEDDDFWGGPRYDNYDSVTTLLSDFFNNGTKKVNYTYDFGDDWTHEIKLWAKPKEEPLYPICIDGEGPSLMEDCGGIWGFYNMLEILNSKKNTEEKKDYLEWVGLKSNQKYEEEFAFNKEEINKSLIEVFRDVSNSSFDPSNF